MALGSCSSQDTEEIKLRKIEIELLSSKIVALDSLYKELELCDTEDFESMWKILTLTLYTRQTATMEKYLSTNEEQLNHELYTNVLQHMQDMVDESDRMKEMSRK